jgi:hypothetical protein
LVYAFRVRAAASDLIDSASTIHSTADAKNQIAKWRNRSDCSFWENSATGNGDKLYEIRIENGLLGRLGITRPTMLGMTIALDKAELRYITVVMFTGRTPISTAGVWIQEWFGLGSASDFRLDRKDEPRKATLEFSSDVPESERGAALRLSTKCFIQFGGCKSADDILPGVWQWADGRPPSMSNK